MIRLIICAATCVIATGSSASTPTAWAQGNAAARTACVKAADFTQATASAPVIFSDVQMKTAILVTGRYRQPHMKGARGQALCLYDRRSKRAEVSEAKGWSAR